MDSIPYSEVRARLAETLKRLEVREEAIYISRRGQPAGVLMSVAQYRRLQADPGDFGGAMLAWRKRVDRELAAEPAGAWPDPFADVRDRSPDGGRPPFDWPHDLPEGAPKAKPQAKALAKRQAKPRPRP